MTTSETAEDSSVRSPSDLRADHQPMGPVSVFLALMTITLWGGTAVANQVAIDVFPPLFVGVLRFGLAAIFMVFWCRIDGTPVFLTGRQLWLSSLVGVLMFVQIATFNYGTAISNASHATVLVNSYIFWVAIYEGWVRRSVRFRWWQVFGLFLAGSGVLLLVGNANNESLSEMDQPTLWGDLILASSGFVLAIKILLVKKAVQEVPPTSMILWHDIVGTALLFVLSVFTETPTGKPITTDAVIAILYGGIAVSGACFAINAMLLQKHGASQVSVFSFGTPLVGILLAYFIRGDHLSRWLVTSGLFVAAGIYLVNRNRPFKK
ncbi:putative DMT superfamily transporter inner membrane protein [Thalassoglobus neptunius]|uniref:Putative DMT superfamily transporter inner membrane protein n=1 Tax=Thalassoglobus neptunius TaxID=1938619 RepID=A0A5C5X7S7_9PLAN|nr:DMT family transporter [Thalassoglobus neptunius]TWT58401.1 putative DMT superfamily transporter inner membrane protein [Thalassoglobus neptunius]